MWKNILATLGTALVMDRAGMEPIEFVVSTLEKLAWGLEEVASLLEE